MSKTKELQERVERLEKGLNKVRELLYRKDDETGGWLCDPTFSDFGAVLDTIDSALSGEATKEKEESDAVYTALKSFTEKMWLRLFQPERDELQIILDDVKELENKISSDWYVKIINKESIEAYNRECKRVDELTEELQDKKDQFTLAYNSAKRRQETIELQRKNIEELEGLLKEIIRFKPSLLTCIQKDFQYPDNAIKALEDAEKSLNL